MKIKKKKKNTERKKRRKSCKIPAVRVFFGFGQTENRRPKGGVGGIRQEHTWRHQEVGINVNVRMGITNERGNGQEKRDKAIYGQSIKYTAS